MTSQTREENRDNRRPRPRIETLSDLIYGLSLSIGAISLVITNGQTSTHDINKNIFDFLFLFFILITSWIIYTSDMSVLPVETRLITFLNVVLLMLVAIIPYLFDQARSTVNSIIVQDYASILFTTDFAATLLILAIFAHVIAIEEKQLVKKELMARFRRTRNILLLLSAIVLTSLIPPWEWSLLGVPIRLFIWYVPILMFWFNRMTRNPIGTASSI